MRRHAIWNEDNILDQLSRKTTAKKPVWGEMAVSLHDLSFPSRTGEQIKTKVHDLSAAYKDIVDLVKPSGAGTEVLEEFRSRDRSSGGIPEQGPKFWRNSGAGTEVLEEFLFSSKCGM